MERELRCLLVSFLFLGTVVNSGDSSQVNLTATLNETSSDEKKKNDMPADQGSVLLAHEELRLVTHLFKDYDKNVRPVSEPGENLSVVITPAIRQIIQVDERRQVMTLYFWLRMWWYDKNLLWDKNEFSNISKVNVEPGDIWLPDISLSNSAQEGQDALIYRKIKTKVQVHEDGLCKWLSPYFSSTSCMIDSTNFPFDEQNCTVEMASWTQTGMKIDVNLGVNKIDVSSYKENIQWKLVSAKAYKKITKYAVSTDQYPSLLFAFVIRRRSLFYIVNLIFPCVILSFLSLMTFYIPTASGERITLSISLLLTMLFTLYIITENLPPDSTTVPLLTKFVGVAMLVMTTSLFATSVVIKFEDRPEVMPKWISLLVNKYLGYLVLHNTSWFGKCTRSTARKNRGEAILNTREDNQEQSVLNFQEEEEATTREQSTRKVEIITDLNNQHTSCRHRMTPLSENRQGQEDQASFPGSSRIHDPVMADIANKFRCLSSQVEKRNAEEELGDEWKEAGVILNKLFLWSFFAVLLFSTIAIFSKARYTE